MHAVETQSFGQSVSVAWSERFRALESAVDLKNHELKDARVMRTDGKVQEAKNVLNAVE